MTKENFLWALVVAQLAEQSLPTPEICDSNQDIYLKYNRKEENKEKEARNGPSLKNQEGLKKARDIFELI